MIHIDLPREMHPFYLYTNSNPSEVTFVFNGDWSYTHYTIKYRIGKELDIHRTIQFPGSRRKKYIPLVKIPQFTLGRILVYLNHNLPKLSHLYLLSNTINLGKLKKYNCLLFPLECGEDHFSDMVISKGKKIRFAKGITVTNPDHLFIEPDDVLLCKSQAFILYRVQKGRLRLQGYIYKHPHRPESRKFFFVPTNTMFQFAKAQMHLFTQILHRVNFEGKEMLLVKLKEEMAEQHLPIASKIAS